METLKLQEIGLEDIPVVPKVIPNHTTLNTGEIDKYIGEIDRLNLIHMRGSLKHGDPIKLKQVYKLTCDLETIGAIKILDLILNMKTDEIQR